MIFVGLLLKPCTSAPHLPPGTSVCCSPKQHFYLCYVQLCVGDICSSLSMFLFVSLVSSFKYTTVRIRKLSLASLASALSARRSSLPLATKGLARPPPLSSP